MKIGFDVDGVLTDFEWFIDYFGAKYLKNKKLPSKVFDLEAYSFKKKYNCSDYMEYNFYKKYLIWYSTHMPIRENAAQTINCLKKEGHSIHIITARVMTDKKNMLGFLFRYFLKNWLRHNNVKYDSIHFVDFQNSQKEKASLCKKLKLDFYVEDEPSNILKIKNICQVICVSARYNNDLSGVYRVNDFTEIYNIITKKQLLKLPNEKEQLLMNILEREQYYKNLKVTISKLPFDKKAIYKYKINHKIIMCTIGRLLKKIVSIQYKDLKRNPFKSNAIYVCNHRRFLDIPIAYCLLNKTYARFLIKREYQFTLWNIIQKKLGTIYVGREYAASRKSSLITMLQTVLNNESVLIFPEGTRNKTSELLLPFQYGAVKISQITGRPIIPIVIYKDNNFKYKAILGEIFRVSIYDSLEIKNKELWNIMHDTYIKLQEKSNGK